MIEVPLPLKPYASPGRRERERACPIMRQLDTLIVSPYHLDTLIFVEPVQSLMVQYPEVFEGHSSYIEGNFSTLPLALMSVWFSIHVSVAGALISGTIRYSCGSPPTCTGFLAHKKQPPP